jgi:hypothetical protein
MQELLNDLLAYSRYLHNPWNHRKTVGDNSSSQTSDGSDTQHGLMGLLGTTDVEAEQPHAGSWLPDAEMAGEGDSLEFNV